MASTHTALACGFALCGLVAAAPGFAQPAPDPAQPGPAQQAPAEPAPPDALRYSFVPAEGGALKLDRESGKVSFCGRRDASYTCEAVPDTRDAYEAEIGRLQARIAELEGRADGKGSAVLLPDREDVNAALDYAAGLLRRLKAAIEDIATGNPPPAKPQ